MIGFSGKLKFLEISFIVNGEHTLLLFSYRVIVNVLLIIILDMIANNSPAKNTIPFKFLNIKESNKKKLIIIIGKKLFTYA
jgi:hypothetical protein|tara:strand:- start:914 stop:1156 length:243 start_codon:yes stop_codon:yes gene_type:complete